MTSTLILLCCFLICGTAFGKNFTYPKFPDDFMFGVSTSSYQIEGAWNIGGRSEGIWDKIIHERSNEVADNNNADDAANSYYLYKRDVEMLQELGVDLYRFSLSWSRILPNGTVDYINYEGLDYYNRLVDELIRKNIKPMVSLYHWDLPQVISDKGGFLSDDFPRLFEDYARLVFKTLGDRVKFWITFNEPMEICIQGYGMRDRAPQLNYHGYGEYRCTANLLGAHARAYHLYNTTFKPTQKGKIGISVSAQFSISKTDSEIDKLACEDALQFYQGLFLHPIYSKEGGYPPEVIARVDKHRLINPPQFPELRNTSDFLGVNHYDLFLVDRTERRPKQDNPSFNRDLDVNELYVRRWSKLWVKLGPSSLGTMLERFKKLYNDPEIIITENGLPSGPGLNDKHRVWYIRRYLAEILRSIQNGIKIKGYAMWSLMDNFEWFRGYSDRYGLYEIDFNDRNKTRIPRRSAMMYKEIIRSRTIDPDFMNDAEYKEGKILENLSFYKFTPKFDTKPLLKNLLENRVDDNESDINVIIKALENQILTYNKPFD